ncbi:MAG: ComEC/Rec2 family competence protein, partial [bacterium]|nr:ComEC/Rec2 family competence protein [bacterium]
KNPGSFSSTRYYQSKGVEALGFVSDPVWVVRLKNSGSGLFQKNFEKIRRQVRRAVTEKTAPPASHFLLGLLTGERKELGKTWEENFRKAGVSHILSISGLHVTMVALFFLFLFRVLSSSPLAARHVWFLRFYMLPAIPLIWLYVAVAGFPVPAIRAGFAATLVLAGLSLWRKLDLLSVLALAAFLILSVSPLLLFQASFQLSFTAAGFLILFFPRWRRWRGERLKIPPAVGWILDGLAVSFITLLGLLPILLFHFHEASLMGIAANLIVVPLVNFFVMPLGMAGWILSGLFDFNAAWIWKGAGGFASLTLHLVSFFADHADAVLFFGAIKIWQIPFYYAVIWMCFLPKTVFQGKRRLALALGLMAIFSSGYMLPKNGDLKVTFLDVGQGDCAVIELPDGKVWVLDGGGIKGSDWDIGRHVVAPYLWENNIHKIDALFLSHPHHDHYKGLGFLAEHFDPKVLYLNGDAA